MRHRPGIACVACVAIGCAGHARRPPRDEPSWSAYGATPQGQRFSPLEQIDRGNVAQLRVAWTYRSGDLSTGGNTARPALFETTPIYVAGTLYVNTPFGRVVALDPERGTARWTYDPGVDLRAEYGDFASRGVAAWHDPQGSGASPCGDRIFVATVDARLIALDAARGAPCVDFGATGVVDLRRDVRNGVRRAGEYGVTSPPVVVAGLVVVGSTVADNARLDAPAGVVRAFDARTGALRWAWDPVAQDPADPAYATWSGPHAHETGAANAWAPLAADEARDLVFVPTGSPAPDYYGGERAGANRYANSLVALRASTGRVVWHFQAVHHDLWDYDLASQPTLVTIRRGGRDVPAVVQATKMGFLFVLDRETGVPLFPVDERVVPRSTVPGEQASPTQPFPTLPRPLAAAQLAVDGTWGEATGEREFCQRALAGRRSDGIYTPPSLEGTVMYPGNAGGSAWGGVAVDPARGVLVANTNRVAALVQLIPREQYAAQARDDGGAPGERATSVIGRPEYAEQRGTPYGLRRQILITPRHAPCNPPPWGMLTAVDLATGEVRWEHPFGTWAASPPEHAAAYGSPSFGGPMATAAGLVFIAASYDARFRAFDTDTGREVWSTALPAVGRATPMTYRGPTGRQYVVLCVGGDPRSGLAAADHVIAYALP